MSVGHTVYECVILREEFTLGVGKQGAGEEERSKGSPEETPY